MKDIIISGKVLKRELLVLLGCFLAALGVNVYSIIKYKTPFYEIFTQIGYVLLLMLIIWVAVTVIRLVVYLIAKLIKR